MLVIVGWGASYVTRHPAEVTAIRCLSIGRLSLLFVLSVAKLVSMGLFTWIIVWSLGIELRFVEWFGLSAVSAMGNYLTPFRAGAAARAVYLKSRHDLSYSLFLSSLSILYVLTLSTNAALGVLASLGLYFWVGFFDEMVFLVFLCLLVVPVTLLVLISKIPLGSKSLGRKARAMLQQGLAGHTLLSGASRSLIEMLIGIVKGWRIVASDRGTPGRLLAASVLNASVTLLMIHFSFTAFETDLSLLESLVLSSLFMISSMIPITPSGLGVAELVVVLASRGFSESSSVSVLAVALSRTVMVVSSLVWGGVFSYAMGQSVISSSDVSGSKGSRGSDRDEEVLRR